MQVKRNWLILSGTRQNVGKTTVACNLTMHYKELGVVAIKISPHMHTLTPGLRLLYEQDGIQIAQETEISGKDTGRYLQAGAHKAYYLQCHDDLLQQALIWLLPFIPEDVPVICESAKARGFIEPGVFVMLGLSEDFNRKPDVQAIALNPHLHFTSFEVFDYECIEFVNRMWCIVS